MWPGGGKLPGHGEGHRIALNHTFRAGAGRVEAASGCRRVGRLDTGTEAALVHDDVKSHAPGVVSGDGAPAGEGLVDDPSVELDGLAGVDPPGVQAAA